MTFFHQNLKTLREQKGLSQSKMGERYGLSQSGYGRWENNAVPDLDTVVDVASFFEVTVDDLLLKDLSQKASSSLAMEQDGPAYRASLPNDERAQLHQLVVDLNMKIKGYGEVMGEALAALLAVGKLCRTIEVSPGQEEQKQMLLEILSDIEEKMKKI